MKTRLLALMMCLMLLISCAAGAEEQVPTDEFFERGRTAVTLLAAGQTDEALQTIGFVFDVESGLTEETFKEAIGQLNLLDSGLVQVEVAACWRDAANVWHLGIPLVEPTAQDVEVLVLDSRDLQVFCGYSITDWGTLSAEIERSGTVYWNQAYVPGEIILMTDE